jgi:hypothetical protein
MISQLWEFLFCPVHGVFAPANWQAINLALISSREFITALYLNYRHIRLRNLGVL